MAWRWAAGGAGAIFALLYLGNASWLWGEQGRTLLLAHRGVAQQFSREGLDRQTCTAARMLPPRHAFLENTITSIEAAFGFGADIVEIDIHPTVDGEFVVFHDWTLDCRTNGQGVTREQTVAYLQSLDIGHGYTADGGETFPFRGKFVGAMPTLEEALGAFPDKRFLINIKSNDATEGALLARYLARRSTDFGRLAFYGADSPIGALRDAFPAARTVTRSTLKRCITKYLASGWIGRVPSVCERTMIFVPVNYRLLLWGWPNLFVERMRNAQTDVFVVGPLKRETAQSGATSIDDPAAVRPFIRGFAGGVATDRIEVMGPYLRGGAASPSSE